VEENHIPIRDQRVSRYHLQLEYRDHVLVVRDLNSKYGTYYQDHRVEGSLVLKPGEILTVGDTELFFEILGEEYLPAEAKLNQHPIVSEPQGIRDSLHFYLEQDLVPFRRRREVKPPDHMVRILLRTLFVPFVVLFGLFVLFPSFISCLITLGYAGIALALSNNLLSRSAQKESFSLPVTLEIKRLHQRIQEKINALPEVEQRLMQDISDEITKFVNTRMHSMEKDIYTLNQSLIPGMGQRLERKKASVEEKLVEKQDRTIRTQLKRSLSILMRQIKLHDKIKNLLTGLILRLEDFQAQLQILEGTIVAQGFIQAPTEFANNFLELQQDIDRFYEEYKNLERLE
jgi:pSer/pThr/pTyr-binding forkhead associated (FHA) protein